MLFAILLVMVWVKNVSMEKVFICDICGLGFSDAKTAIACEAFCKENKTRSSKLAELAIYHP